MGVVVSWDQVHVQNGYTSNFFGCYDEDVKRFKLQPGDRIEVLGGNGQTMEAIFVQASGKRGSKQRVDGKLIRYLYVKDHLKTKIRDGMHWRKMVDVPEPGFNPKRVSLFFDPESGHVVGVPRTG